MIDNSKLALFTLLGQTAQKAVTANDQIRPNLQLELYTGYDLAVQAPDSTKRAMHASEAYILFFVFEEYLRELVKSVLAEGIAEKNSGIDWWDTVPQDVKDYVKDLEEQEDTKKWMALNPRGKASLLTLPQLLRIIDEKDNWKNYFEDVLLDRALVGQARILVHLRNNICHMSDISGDEIKRIKQVMKDWFRAAAP